MLLAVAEPKSVKGRQPDEALSQGIGLAKPLEQRFRAAKGKGAS